MAERNRKFVWQDRMTESSALDSKAVAVGLALSLKDNGNGTRWFMSDEELVRRTKLSASSVKRGRAQLVAEGWLEVVNKGGRSKIGTTWATEYRLRFPQRRSQGWGAASANVG